MHNFASPQKIQRIVEDQKNGLAVGVYSVCSSNHFVLQACLQFARTEEPWILIESTCNQVNQYGGYTGMRSAQFSAYIANLAEDNEYPVEKILLGGDHLGPNPWKDEKAVDAMTKAKVLVRDYISAGYRKIHLDTSMACADDQDNQPLDLEVEAHRAADLAQVSEDTWHQMSMHDAPVYVIGTEVPVPGGADSDDEDLQITSPDRASRTLAVYQQVFNDRGLADAWDRVIALVVQPGVEFSQYQVHDYDPASARLLVEFIEGVSGLIYEAHSTDYQLPGLLRQMVKDHFAILKVGPGLTFAFREAVFALARIEQEWHHDIKRMIPSRLEEVADQVMIENPADWEGYYDGNAIEKTFARKYSYSDRIRYYWPDPMIDDALNLLISNHRREPPPLAMISQYLPVQYQHIREGILKNDPQAIIIDHIQEVLRDYANACAP